MTDTTAVDVVARDADGWPQSAICQGCRRLKAVSKMSGGPAEGWLCDPCEMAAFAEAG